MSSATDKPNSPAPATAAPVAEVTASLRLRAIEPADGPELHALLLTSLPGVPRDRRRWLARWHWQTWDNPFRENRPAGWVIEAQGRLMGHLGAVYLPWRVAGGPRLGMIATDYAVAPEALVHGGAFAGLTLAQAFFDATAGAFPLATTANEKTGAVFARYGCRPVPWTREFWRAPTTTDQQVRTCRGANSRLARKVLGDPNGGTSLRLAGWLYASLHHRPAVPIPAGCRIETTTPRLALDLGRIQGDLAGPRTHDAQPGGFTGIDRSQPYFDWRYGRHPEQDRHRVITIRDADGTVLAGAVILFESTAGLSDEAATTTASPLRALVTDLIAPSHRDDLVKTLFCAALLLAADHEAEFLVTTAGQDRLRPLFWELGFEPRARNAPAVVLGGDHPADGALDFWCGAMF